MHVCHKSCDYLILTEKKTKKKNNQKALTTVGHFMRPKTNAEYIYVAIELLFGIFLFAAILGHVADIVTSVSFARKEFQGLYLSRRRKRKWRRRKERERAPVVRERLVFVFVVAILGIYSHSFFFSCKYCNVSANCTGLQFY